MVDTKPIGAVVKKYTDAIGRVPAAYRDGVQASTGQNQKAIDAEELWKIKIAEAAANNSRVKGLQASSDEDWKRGALNKGASRIGPGMQGSLDKYGRKMAENLATIQSVSIPARVADPMANIDNRLKPIAKALHDQKMKR